MALKDILKRKDVPKDVKEEIKRDLTERKQTEEKFKENEALLNKILAKISAGIIIIDAKSHIIEKCNDFASELFGASIEQIVGHKCHKFICQAFEKECPVTDHGKEVDNSEKILIRSDGSTIPVLKSVKKIIIDGQEKLLESFVDISNLKKTEDALKQSEERLKDITFSMADWVWEVDENGVYTYSSHKSSDFLGRPIEEIIGKTPFDFMPQDEAKRIAPIFSEIVAKRAPIIDLENWNIGKNGENICILSNGVPMFDTKGNFKGYRGIDKNITNRKQAEEILRNNKEKLDLAIISAKLGVWELLIKENKRIFDDQTCSILGINPSTFGGSMEEFFAVIHPDDREKVKAALVQTIDADVLYEPEYRVILPDRSIHYVTARGKLIRDDMGNPQSISGVIWDKTERKQAEIERTRQSGLITSLLDSIPDIVFYKDINGVYLGCNPPFAEFVGKSREEIVGKTDYDLVDKEIADFFRLNDKKMLETKQPSHNEEWITYPDGRKILIDTLKTPYWGIDGNLIGILGISRDITERKKSETDLLQTTKRLSLAAKAGSVGIWEYDVVNNTLIWDDQMFALYGITRDQFVGVYEAWQSGLHPEDKLKGDLEIQMALSGEKEFNTEFRVLWPSGDIHNIRAIAIVERDDSGNPLRMIGTNWDITDQKQLEAKLKSSEENFRVFFESINDMIFVATVSGEVLYINPAVSEKLGYNLEEMNRIGILGIHPEEKQKEAEEIFTAMFKGERDYCPLPVQSKNGIRIPVETRVWFGKWNGLDCIFGISKDLSIQQAAFEKFQKLFDNNPALMALSSLPERKFIDINRAFLEKLKYDKDEVIGKTAEDLNLFVEPEKQIEIGNELIQTGRIYSKELKVRTKSGEILTSLFFGEIIDNQLEKIFLTVMTDITAQKRAEEESKAASKAKSEFLANMSHEIRTPLNGVIGFTELLINTKLEPVQKQYVQNANTSAHSLLDIINDILDFSKIEAGKLELDEIRTDVIELLEQTIDIINYTASDKGIELLLNIPPNVPRFITIDPIRIKQVLVNLISNAVKFTRKGEIELSLQFEPYKEDIGIFTFSVRDTGIGISTEQRKKLFKAFSQADTSTTRKFGGTGLGLTISGMLVEKMESLIGLDSEEGKGSRFYFSIKRTFEHGDQPMTKNFKDVKRVLVVDDNENNRIIMQHTLQNWQIETELASNGLESLAKVEKCEPFDVLIIDYNMPYMNGIETIRMLRDKLNVTPETTSIILLHSSSEDALINEDCKNLAIYHKLVKPVKSKELFNYLSNIHEPLPLEKEIVENDNSKIQDTIKNGFKTTIMIAEDVPLNMILVKAIIDKLDQNCIYLEAKNGAEAIEHYKNGNPDLIFMDVQMPIMDGYTACREIRKIEKGTGKHTPIIALTAGAIVGEKERCLESGMDDFLTKPIEVNAIKAALEKYHKKTIIDQQSEKEKPIEKVIHFNKEQLLERLGGRYSTFNKLQDCFIPDLTEYLEELKLQIAEGNIESIQRAAHKIKGASLTMCCNILAGWARKIEETEEYDANKINELFKELLDELGMIKNEIEENKKISKRKNNGE